MRLDKFLQAYRSGIGTLTRVVGSTHQSSFSVDVPAHVRDYTPEEISGTEIIQGDRHVIVSPTEIIANQWPGPIITPPTPKNDPRVPVRGDKFGLDVWQGAISNVEEGQGIYLDDELVRIEFRIRG